MCDVRRVCGGDTFWKLLESSDQLEGGSRKKRQELSRKGREEILRVPMEWCEHRNCVTLGFPGCGCVCVKHRRRRKATGAGVVEPVDEGFRRR